MSRVIVDSPRLRGFRQPPTADFDLVAIAPANLTAVTLVERSLRELLRPEVVRCRLREDGIVVELDETTLDALSERRRHELHDLVRAAWADRGDRPVSLAPYRRGSAFLRSRAEV